MSTYEKEIKKIRKMVKLAKEKVHLAVEKALTEAENEVISELRQDQEKEK